MTDFLDHPDKPETKTGCNWMWIETKFRLVLTYQIQNKGDFTKK
jgi:hypothetical protein